MDCVKLKFQKAFGSSVGIGILISLPVLKQTGTKLLFLACLCVVFTAGCKKGPIHENLIIDGNIPPPYDGVSEVTLNTFLNRLFIDLVGRGPTSAELGLAVSQIRTAEFSEASIENLVNELQLRYEFYKNFDVLTKSRLLNGTDSLEVVYEIDYFNDLIDFYQTIGDTATALIFELGITIHENLRTANLDLYNQNIGIEEYFKRHILNSFFDEINMGSENFVLAVFENLFFREPTVSELNMGIIMVDGAPAFLFLEDGTNKLDFIDIAVQSASFEEGIVSNVFTNFLARSPSSQELADNVNLLNSGASFLDIQKAVIKTEEYAGFYFE